MPDAIVRKRLMTLRKVSGTKRKALVICLLLIVGAVVVGDGMGDAGGAAVGGFVAVIMAPFAWLWVLVPRLMASRANTMSAEIKAEARAHLASMAGREPRYIDVDAVSVPSAMQSLVGTGIAYDGEKIYVLDAGEVAVIPWSAIRNWTWKLDGYSQTETFGNTSGAERFQVAQSNQNARIQALHNSGFFVTVADVERPVWQFMSTDKAVLNKWHEIFQQIKEGRLQVA